jgi:ATP-dependent DNA helicase RecQ
VLEQVFGYQAFRGDQRPAIDELIAGRDVLVLMPTGGGKSLCYQIPALVRPGVGVVISPLIALMEDQVDALRQLGVRAACLNSNQEREAGRQAARQLARGELDLVYVAPERLFSESFLATLARLPIALFAIDEAHCISQWGHDFREEYLRLAEVAQRFPGVPRIALTATADGPTRREIVERLQLGSARTFIASFDRPNIRYRISTDDQPRVRLLELIRQEHAGQAGIVYCLSRKKVESTASWLLAQGIPAAPYHAGLSAEQRREHQRRFIHEEGRVIVATIAFGMGIDKPNVRFVAHMDLPRSLEHYYQETGRAGRDGLPATAWLSYGLSGVVALRQMLAGSNAATERKRLEHHKLEAMLGLCESTTCRRHVLLRYFAASPDGAFGDLPHRPAFRCRTSSRCVDRQADTTRL